MSFGSGTITHLEDYLSSARTRNMFAKYESSRCSQWHWIHKIFLPYGHRNVRPNPGLWPLLYTGQLSSTTDSNSLFLEPIHGLLVREASPGGYSTVACP